MQYYLIFVNQYKSKIIEKKNFRQDYSNKSLKIKLQSKIQSHKE